MRRLSFEIIGYLAILITAIVLFLATTTAWGEPCPCTPPPCEDGDNGATWIFQPSYYSHDPETGQRVAQYAPLPKVYPPYDPTYRESGFHYTQSILRGPDGSVDALHLIQSWGRGDQIRPYGEWLYPYRAGATPFGPWGNPQGPWTLPFDSWANPYGLGQLPYPPWPVYPYNNPNPGYNSYPGAVPYGNHHSPPAPGMNYGPSPMPYGNGGFNPGGQPGGFEGAVEE
ncbi:MAG: hypothetical protein IT426_13020 [Pirellulales bacterium]|nr:hypothetical protein [Pirellulales bacterium]